MMIRCAIVEDEDSAAGLLKQHVERYGKEKNIPISVKEFRDPVTFLANFKVDYDVIFMDIKMPEMDGMELANEVRKMDSSVIIIFVTDMVQYAIDGYSVSALDFIVKPIAYEVFVRAMNKATKLLYKANNDELILKNNGVMRRVRISGIYYVEVQRHRIIYHTEDGDVEGWGSLDSVAQSLPKDSFVKCNISYLVNLAHVTTVSDNDVFVHGECLRISRNRKKEFMSELAKYLGGR